MENQTSPKIKSESEKKNEVKEIINKIIDSIDEYKDYLNNKRSNHPGYYDLSQEEIDEELFFYGEDKFEDLLDSFECKLHSKLIDFYKDKKTIIKEHIEKAMHNIEYHSSKLKEYSEEHSNLVSQQKELKE